MAINVNKVTVQYDVRFREVSESIQKLSWKPSKAVLKVNVTLKMFWFTSDADWMLFTGPPTCRLMPIIPNLGSYVYFTVCLCLDPPVVQISPTVTSVEEGTELVLVCDIDAEPKEVQIEWGHQSIELQDTHRNVLSIPNVTRSHGGRYTCTVKNEHGSASKSAQVTILCKSLSQLGLSELPKSCSP